MDPAQESGGDGEASMAEDRERAAAPGPSALTARFIKRRQEMAAASAAIEAADAAARAQRPQEPPDDEAPGYQNAVALIGGIVALALLLAGFIFVLDRLHGDSWFADCPPSAHGNCR